MQSHEGSQQRTKAPLNGFWGLRLQCSTGVNRDETECTKDLKKAIYPPPHNRAHLGAATVEGSLDQASDQCNFPFFNRLRKHNLS